MIGKTENPRHPPGNHHRVIRRSGRKLFVVGQRKYIAQLSLFDQGGGAVGYVASA